MKVNSHPRGSGVCYEADSGRKDQARRTGRVTAAQGTVWARLPALPASRPALRAGGIGWLSPGIRSPCCRAPRGPMSSSQQMALHLQQRPCDFYGSVLVRWSSVSALPRQHTEQIQTAWLCMPQRGISWKGAGKLAGFQDKGRHRAGTAALAPSSPVLLPSLYLPAQQGCRWRGARARRSRATHEAKKCLSSRFEMTAPVGQPPAWPVSPGLRRARRH